MSGLVAPGSSLQRAESERSTGRAVQSEAEGQWEKPVRVSDTACILID